MPSPTAIRPPTSWARRTPPRRCVLRPDDEGEVVATLVHRPAATSTAKAVLHVHGFADYFFQTGRGGLLGRARATTSTRWTCASTAARCGRTRRRTTWPTSGQYYEELDLASQRVAEDHDHVVFSAHSTGGLTVPLWLHDRRHAAAGVFLNAPWIDMHGDAFTRLAGACR